MNLKMTAGYLGLSLKALAAFLTLPLIFALLEGEIMAAKGFLLTMALTVAGFAILGLIPASSGKTVRIRDGFMTVGICWIVISFYGGLPFLLSGAIPSMADAFFESVSGFTTTGASILTAVEGLPRSLLLWRSFSHWIGGMGVLVFLMAVVPAIAGGDRSISVMKAESSGPAPGKLVPRLRQSSKILYMIYFTMTVLQALLLLAGGMPLFDSVVNALATAGTGGFAVKNASIAAYGSAYADIVITVFMVLFGISFNIYYFLLIRNFSAAYRNDELRAYLAIFAGASVLMAVNLTGGVYGSFAHSLRHSAFQAASVMTTTGFASTDYNLWPTFSKMVLFTLTFIGGCAGSTAGGIKVTRLLLVIREAKRVLFRMVNPRSVEPVRLDGRPADMAMIHGVSGYFVTIFILFFSSALVLSLDGFDFETTISATAACLNNVGPGFGMVGPAGNFSEFSILSKLVLSLDMLLGRLEVYPILLLFSPRSWRRG